MKSRYKAKFTIDIDIDIVISSSEKLNSNWLKASMVTRPAIGLEEDTRYCKWLEHPLMQST